MNTWFVLLNGNIEKNDDDIRGQGSLPVHHEHDDDANQSSGQGQPFAVVLVLWTPDVTNQTL
jgi:hypothetical protein